jgi:hypothetical protein
MLGMHTVDALYADLARVGARFDTLIPFWLGEPLIHPEFGAIWQASLRVATEHGVFGAVELHTNATHLDRARARLALNEAPIRQVWHLSLDAATRDTYRRVKGRDLFDTVEANITAFLAEKVRLGAVWPRPVFQFIVGRNNANEAEAFVERWTRVCRDLGIAARVAAQDVPPGDDPVVYLRQLDAPTPEDQSAENRIFRDVVARLGLRLPRPELSPAVVVGPNRAVCASPWKSPTVGWDGTVTMCTRDNAHRQALGNLHQTPFSELWWGPAMGARRARVAAADYDGLEVCASCFIPRSGNTTGITEAEIGGWLRSPDLP